MDQQKINVMSINSPEDCKSKGEREELYEQLQTILEEISHQELSIFIDDFNARIGNEIFSGVKERLNKEHVNANGELMIILCAFIELRINNTFFDQEHQ